MKSTALNHLLAGCILLAVLASCTSPEPDSPCDSEEGPCIAVTFDGTNCTVEGRTDTHADEFALIFANESEGQARVEGARLKEDKTIEDLVEDTESRPEGYAPSWATPLGFWDKIVDPGETVTFRSSLLPADYGILCFKVPQYAIFGDGFTIEE